MGTGRLCSRSRGINAQAVFIKKRYVRDGFTETLSLSLNLAWVHERVVARLFQVNLFEGLHFS